MAFLGLGKKKPESGQSGFDDFPEVPPLDPGNNQYGMGKSPPPEPMLYQQPAQDFVPQNQAPQYPPSSDMNYQQAQPQDAYGQTQNQYAPPQDVFDEEKIHRVVEAIIDEKWNDVAKDMAALRDWKDRISAKIMQQQQQIDDYRHDVDVLKQGMLGKISDYDHNLSEVGTEIKAMEKVFQQVLPTLTESVNKLEKITKGTPPASGSKK